MKFRGRSGHMSHGMVDLKNGKFMSFNSNCSATRCAGHAAFGWIEYRISEDGGKTYSEIRDLEYSKKVLLDGDHCLSVEKVVLTDDGKIIAFCLHNSSLDCAEPWAHPTYVMSSDEGETWSEARELIPDDGRVYQAFNYEGDIYVLFFANKDFVGTWPLNAYKIYKSTNNGESFELLSVVPIPGVGHAYATMIFDTNGDLHVYAYNFNNEHFMDHAVSADKGKTWKVLEPCYLAKGIRNPQINYIDGVYILHGRGAMTMPGLVLYTSTDATNWDEGEFINDKKTWYAHYSNNLVLKDDEGSFAVIHYSDLYGKENTPTKFAVNENQVILRIKK